MVPLSSNRKETFVLGIVLAFCLYGNAQATPIITNISGSFSSGGSAVIAGSSFGIKATATPLKWDNFEAGTVGNRIGGKNAVIGGAWSDYSSGGVYPVYNNGQLRANSTRSTYHAFTKSNYNCSLQEVHDNQAEWYFSFWYYTTQPIDERQSKPWQMYGSSNDEPMTYMGWGQQDVGDGNLRIGMMDAGYSDPNGGAAANQRWWGGSVSTISTLRNKWVRLDVYLKQSTGGLTNGEFRAWVSNGTDVTTMDIYRYPTKTRSTSNYWRQLMLGEYYGERLASMSVWMDDVYIDNTQARVEICDKSTWVSRTHCEIQIPTAWSESSIAIKANTGSFTTLSGTYLYVVDMNGVVNTNGYLVGSSVRLPSSPPVTEAH